MRALVVYESMYGNTHAIADHIADGLRSSFEVSVVSVGDATADAVQAADLLVVGGPTHAHGMTSSVTRKSAVDDAAKKPDALHLDPDAEGPGLRDWLKGVVDGRAGRAAAFDTRFDAAEVLTGHASHGIAKRLRQHGFDLAAPPESFLVDKHNLLLPGEAVRAEAWGRTIATRVGTC